MLEGKSNCISSVQNERVKTIVKLMNKESERKAAKAFLVEGPRMCAEIPEGTLLSLYWTQALEENLVKNQLDARKAGDEDRVSTAVLQKMQEAEEAGIGFYVSDTVMEKMSGTKNPQGILALVSQPEWTWEDVMGRGEKVPLLVLLDHLQDPGNMGTIFRTAEAAGATGILIGNGSASPLQPKVVRSTMGASFRLPYISFDREEDFLEAMDRCAKEGIAIYAMHLAGDTFYTRDFTEPSGFLIGNEGNGLTDAVAERASRKIRIPMQGKTESLNAAVSATVVLFETERQRLIAAGENM